MWLELLAVALWGGVVALDTTAAFQFMVSQPIVAASVVGLLMGNFPLAFAVGLFLQLIWLNELPIGAAYFSEGNIGSVVAAAVAIFSVEFTGRPTSSLALSLLFGVLTAYIGGKIVLLMRNFNGKRYHTLLTIESLKVSHIERAHLCSLWFLFFSGVITTFVLIFLGGRIVLPLVIDLLPLFVDTWLAPVSSAFLGIGFAILFYIFYSKREWWLLFASVVGGFILVSLI